MDIHKYRGTNKMIAQYREILKKTYLLAKRRHYEYSSSKGDHINPDSSQFIKLSDVEEIKDSSGLLEYLMSQDMDTIKVIQTVMYLGRDYEPETEEEYCDRKDHNYVYPDDIIPDPELQSDDPEKLLKTWFDFSEGVAGFKYKHAEVEQIYHKLPLDEYLERAFIILRIS